MDKLLLLWQNCPGEVIAYGLIIALGAAFMPFCLAAIMPEENGEGE